MKLQRLRALLFHALLLALVGLLGVIATRHPWEVDLSRDGRNTPHPATAKLLQQLDGPVTITAYAPEHPVLRAGIGDLVERLRRSGAPIELGFVDPVREPEAARAAGVRRSGTLVVDYGGGSERVDTPSEAGIADALARLSRRGSPWIVVLTGHGERALTGTAPGDLGQFGQLLEQRGYRVLPLALADTPQLPDNAALVILAAPQSDLTPTALARLEIWLDDGGPLLWLAEGEVRPALLAARLGLQPLPGTVVDAAAAEQDLDTPGVAVSARHPAHPVTQALDGPVLLPGALAWQLRESPGWQATPLLLSSPRSWNETGELTGVLRRTAEAGERRGPLPLGVALTRTAPAGEQRLAVLGDADLFSTAALGLGANRSFGLALVHWLTGERRLLGVPPRQARDLRLDWSAKAAALAVALLLLALPAVLLGIGLWVRWRRRRG